MPLHSGYYFMGRVPVLFKKLHWDACGGLVENFKMRWGMFYRGTDLVGLRNKL